MGNKFHAKSTHELSATTDLCRTGILASVRNFLIGLCIGLIVLSAPSQVPSQERRIENAVEEYSLGIEPKIIQAIISTESRGQANAIRSDFAVLRHQSWYVDSCGKFGLYGQEWGSSAGLMQPLLINAHAKGYRGDLEGLCVIETNIKYGCMILSDYVEKYEEWGIWYAVSAYNRGSAYCTNGNFRGNNPYVEKVRGEYEKTCK